MEIRTAGFSCRRPQLLLDQIYIFSYTWSDPRFFIFKTTTSRFEKWWGRQFYTKYDFLAEGFFRLPCVSIETHNLQRIFRPRGGGGVVPYMGMCGAKGYGFQPFWSEIGYGLCPLVLNWICFWEELATFSSLGDKTISLLMFMPTTVHVP